MDKKGTETLSIASGGLGDALPSSQNFHATPMALSPFDDLIKNKFISYFHAASRTQPSELNIFERI